MTFTAPRLMPPAPLQKTVRWLTVSTWVIQSRITFRDFIEKERIFIAPNLHWQASADNEFNLNLEYINDNPSMTDTGFQPLATV